MSGHYLAREPGPGEQRDFRLGEIPMPIRPSSSAQPLLGSKRSLDGPAPSHSVDSPTAALPSKKVGMNEIETQTAETSETFEKRENKDWKALCANLMSTRRKRRIVTNGRESTTSYRSLSRRRRSSTCRSSTMLE